MPDTTVSAAWSGVAVSGERLNGALDRVGALPALPEAWYRVCAVLDDPTASAAGVARELSLDPSLAASVLRLANSAVFGFRGTIQSLDRAVAVLGFAEIRNLLLTASVRSAVERMAQGTPLDVRSLWDHSIAVAVAAREVAEASLRVPPDQAFAAGLLHDIGILVMAVLEPSSLRRIVTRAEREAVAFRTAELRTLAAGGVTGRADHAELGAALLARWRLPDELVRAAGGHHPGEGGGRNAAAASPLAAVVHVADVLAHTIAPVDAPPLERGPAELHEATWRRLGVEGGVDALMAAVGATLAGRAGGAGDGAAAAYHA
jgi:putative nucleotidyltransferase with HDIG domain